MEMQGHFFLQDAVDACVDYMRDKTPDSEAKALNTYLSAEAHGYSRKQLDAAITTVEQLLNRNFRTVFS